MIQAAVFGYGTVGSGVVEVIEKNGDIISKKANTGLQIRYILDLRDFPGDPYEDRIVHDVDIILNDPEVTVICETMGGIEPAYTFSRRALERGKSVCTSNKELVAAHGPELLRLAKANRCNYLFEASVGGGIPIIRTLNDSLTAERIESITGILNGTTNYILTRMEQEGADFDEVLREAQEKGYAEKDPTADIDGYDACRKIAILSSLMTGKTVRYDRVYTEGIRQITAADFLYAGQLRRSIKLLAMSRELEDGRTLAMVAPFLIDRSHPLYMVSGVFNAVLVRGNMLGNSMYYGRGAGKLPTASAVAADMVDCARHRGRTILCIWDEEDAPLAGIEDVSHRFLIRVGLSEEQRAKDLFAGAQEVRVPQLTEEFGLVTEKMTEKAFREKTALLGDVRGSIRLEDL